jgi:hypothetical protein
MAASPARRGPSGHVPAHLFDCSAFLHGTPATAPILALVEEEPPARRAPLDTLQGAGREQLGLAERIRKSGRWTSSSATRRTADMRP